MNSLLISSHVHVLVEDHTFETIAGIGLCNNQGVLHSHRKQNNVDDDVSDDYRITLQVVHTTFCLCPDKVNAPLSTHGHMLTDKLSQ